MGYRRSATLLSLILLLSACTREPQISVDKATNGLVEAAPFNGESYRTPNGRSAITLVSSDELEYRVADGTTYLCKYSAQQDALRVILTVMGTQQVLYFRRVHNGLVSNDGTQYLNSAGLAELDHEKELARQREMEARAAEERARVENERQAKLAAERDAEEKLRIDRVNRPRVEKAIVGDWGFGPNTLAITRDGSEFSAVVVYGHSNIRETLRGKLAADNRLELNPVDTAVINERLATQWSYPGTMWVELSADETALAVSRANRSSDNRWRRTSTVP